MLDSTSGSQSLVHPLSTSELNEIITGYQVRVDNNFANHIRRIDDMILHKDTRKFFDTKGKDFLKSLGCNEGLVFEIENAIGMARTSIPHEDFLKAFRLAVYLKEIHMNRQALISTDVEVAYVYARLAASMLVYSHGNQIPYRIISEGYLFGRENFGINLKSIPKMVSKAMSLVDPPMMCREMLDITFEVGHKEEYAEEGLTDNESFIEYDPVIETEVIKDARESYDIAIDVPIIEKTVVKGQEGCVALIPMTLKPGQMISATKKYGMKTRIEYRIVLDVQRPGTIVVVTNEGQYSFHEHRRQVRLTFDLFGARIMTFIKGKAYYRMPPRLRFFLVEPSVKVMISRMYLVSRHRGDGILPLMSWNQLLSLRKYHGDYGLRMVCSCLGLILDYRRLMCIAMVLDRFGDLSLLMFLQGISNIHMQYGRTKFHLENFVKYRQEPQYDKALIDNENYSYGLPSRICNWA
jgi:hypothetical protein